MVSVASVYAKVLCKQTPNIQEEDYLKPRVQVLLLCLATAVELLLLAVA